jgi:adenine-specific DNA-methyltransferase
MGGGDNTVNTQKPQHTRIEAKIEGFRQMLLRKLHEIVPAAFSQGKLDIEQLQYLIGESEFSGTERYRLTWAGKAVAFRVLEHPTCGTLVPILDQSVDWNTTENIFIEGENLEVLKIMLKAYYGRVKLIYIDPPYNTGNDFIYKDDYIQSLETYLHLTGQSDGVGCMTSNPETGGRYHSDWLTMLYPRVWLARELLRDDGLIFISIDDHEIHNLRIVLDEIFGPENYRNTLIVRRGIKNVQAQFDSVRALAVGHEYIVVYSKNPDYRIRHLRLQTDSRPGSWNSHWRGTNRPTMRYELFGETPTTGQWRWSRQRSLKAIENYRQMVQEIGKAEADLAQEDIDQWYLRKTAEIGEDLDLLRLSATGRPEHYVPPASAKLANTLWTDLSPRGSRDFQVLSESKLFDNPKPVAWIRRILEMATEPAGHDIVMDFFAGSGTTAQAVWELNADDGGNRRFILVQLPTPLKTATNGTATIADITKARLRQARNLFQGSISPAVDLGYRVFRLAPTQFKVWAEPENDPVSQLELFVDGLRDGWQPDAVIAEVALKEAGFGLNFQIEAEPVQSNTVYRVVDPDRDQHFYISLDERFSVDTAFQLPLTPETLLVVRDTALDDATAANLASLCRLKTL